MFFVCFVCFLKQGQVSIFAMLGYLEENEDVVISSYMHIFIKIWRKLITEYLEYRNEGKVHFSLCVLCVSMYFESVW